MTRFVVASPVVADKLRANGYAIAGTKDSDAVRDETFIAYEETQHASAGHVKPRSKVLGGDVFLALENDQVVGYARYDMLWPESVPLLAWLYVEPAYRAQGVSDTLRSYSFDSLAEEGFKAVLRSACTHRPAMISKLMRECGPEAGRLRFEDGAEEVFFWHPVISPRDHSAVLLTTLEGNPCQ